jgi:hypothetical protein
MGFVSATASGIDNTRSFLRAWLAPRVALRTRFAATRDLALELSTSLDLPIIRGRYGFGDVTVIEVPVLLPSASLGLAFEL